MSRFSLGFESFIFCCCAVLFVACFDNGSSAEADNFDAAVVCPETGTNVYGMANRGTFTDERDGEVYKYTTIGSQVWMAENVRHLFPMDTLRTGAFGNFIEITGIESVLNPETGAMETLASECNFSVDSCAVLGLVYNQSAAKLAACPSGWRLPVKTDFDELIHLMGGDELAAVRLRSTSGWRELNRGENLDGTDDCGFNARATQAYRSEFWFQQEEKLYTIQIYSYAERGIWFWMVDNINFQYLRCIKD